MEINTFITSHLHAHYKKLLLLCTATATIYLIKRYIDKKRLSKAKKEKKKIKDFPSVEEIQKFIEDLPFEAVTSGKTVTLKDLLGELSEFSEDEEWKELIASVHTMYNEHQLENKDNQEETGSVVSIYEDPNVISLTSMSPPNEVLLENKKEEVKELSNESRGEGDKEIPSSCKKEDSDAVAVVSDEGQGDQSESW